MNVAWPPVVMCPGCGLHMPISFQARHRGGECRYPENLLKWEKLAAERAALSPSTGQEKKP